MPPIDPPGGRKKISNKTMKPYCSSIGASARPRAAAGGEQHLRPVEGRDREEVEQHQHEIDIHEQEKDIEHDQRDLVDQRQVGDQISQGQRRNDGQREIGGGPAAATIASP